MAGIDIIWPITSFCKRIIVKTSIATSDKGSLVTTLVEVTAVSRVWVEIISFVAADCLLKRKKEKQSIN